ncbi:MAG TPA: MATE family efflux transporter, partial [Candidatus Tectomicrobia bacterium]
GRLARARRVAWIGAGMAAAVTGSIGLCGTLFPSLWLGFFSATPEVLATGTTYLRIVGPTYGCFGLGLALYFASQGFGRLLWPLLAGGIRLLIAVGGGWLAITWLQAGLPALFVAIASAFVMYAVVMVLAIKAGAWGDAERHTAPQR